MPFRSNVRLGSWPRENAEIEFANGNFVSTSINLKNKSAGDGCRDKTIEKAIANKGTVQSQEAIDDVINTLIRADSPLCCAFCVFRGIMSMDFTASFNACGK